MSSQKFLPYGRQTIEDDDVAAVAAVLRGDFLTTGPAVAAFEQGLASLTGAAHAVVCNNATAGLHLAVAALGIGPGDVAVVPTMTFLATANALRFQGADVVFADVDPRTGLMTPETLEAAISSSPKVPRAILPVHLNGWSCDMSGIGAIARRIGARVIEDGAHALGGTTFAADGSEVRVGGNTDADMTVFSFHPVKTVAMGEGGAVTTNDSDLHTRLTDLRSHGMVREQNRFLNQEAALDEDGTANPWYYEMQSLGWNYRASDINCALGLSQLAKLGRFLERREELAALYDDQLADYAPLIRPVPRAPGRSGWHLYPVHIDFASIGRSRAQVMKTLRDKHQVGTQVHYIPVHSQPYYSALYGDRSFPGADAYYAGILSIPFYAGLSDDDAARVVFALTEELGLSRG